MEQVSCSTIGYFLRKVAVTCLFASIVIVHGPVALRPPPLQPKNWKFLFWGVAVNVTIVPTV